MVGSKVFVLSAFILSSSTSAGVVSSFWNTEKSDHFVIYYQSTDHRYISDVLQSAENYYHTITQELGFTRFENFWTWEDRAKIYLFKDREEYQKKGGQGQWSEAHADVVKREIRCYVTQENFFEDVLPHELGHLIFREFIGYKRKIPLWLEEGVAIYLERKYRQERLLLAKMVVNSTYFIPLKELEMIEDSRTTLAVIFYAESASIIEFLLIQYGNGLFVEFCRRLRDLRVDQNWTTAFKQAYSFSSLAEMEVSWKEFLLR